MAKYYGSTCKGDCGGHRAGARYVRGGGRKLSPHSASFNKGMRVAQRQLKKRGKTTRLRKVK